MGVATRKKLRNDAVNKLTKNNKIHAILHWVGWLDSENNRILFFNFLLLILQIISSCFFQSTFFPYCHTFPSRVSILQNSPG